VTDTTVPVPVARLAQDVLAAAVAGPLPFGMVYHTDQCAALENLTQALAACGDAETVTVRARTAARARDAMWSYATQLVDAINRSAAPDNTDYENEAGARYAAELLHAAVVACSAPHAETHYEPDMEEAPRAQ
jgi:hypothetical protein